MNVLVIGGTGTVGRQVVAELAQRGANIKVLTRAPERAPQFPANVQVVRGDLLDPQTVRTVFHGMDGVFMLNPVSPSETHEGLMGVLGAQQAGVRKFSYLTIHRLQEGPFLPHFASKRPVEDALRQSSLEWTLIRPNNFFQNDYWFKDALLQYGVYPQPIGSVGLSRIDVRDIAEASAIALTQAGHARRTYELAGPRALTGDETAAIWSDALGRPIQYAGNDLDAWEQHALQALPAWMVYDFRLMYSFFQHQGLVATAEELETLTQLLGHAPRTFRDFANETAKQWLGR
jgi:uncharacterized protein YbjT (DUF2867 family)